MIAQKCKGSTHTTSSSELPVLSKKNYFKSQQNILAPCLWGKKEKKEMSHRTARMGKAGREHSGPNSLLKQNHPRL